MRRGSPRPFFPSSRAGVELAINTVVVLILGIIIVGGGIAMVWNLVEGGTDLVADVTDAQTRDIEERFADGQLVATAPQSMEIRAGDRGSAAVGVRSILSAQETFTLNIAGTGPDGQPVTSNGQVGSWKLIYFPDLTVDAQKRAAAAITIIPYKDADAGIYTFIVTVTRADGTTIYDSARIFTVRVR